MRTLLLLCAVLLLATTSCSEQEEEQAKMVKVDLNTITESDTVWICTGSAAKRFHSSDSCPGVNSCTKEVKGVTRGEAEKKRRTACNICYRLESED